MNKRLDEIALLKADKAYVKLGDHVSNTDLHVSSCITESDIDSIVTELITTTPNISYATLIYVDGSFYTKSYIDKTFYSKTEVDNKIANFISKDAMYSALGVVESSSNTVCQTITNLLLNQVYTKDETDNLIDKKINNSEHLKESDVKTIVSTYSNNGLKNTTVVTGDTTCVAKYDTYVINALTQNATIILPKLDMKLGHVVKFVCITPANSNIQVSVVPAAGWTMSNVNGSQYDSFVLNSGVSEFIFVNNQIENSMWICTGNYNTTSSIATNTEETEEE